MKNFRFLTFLLLLLPVNAPAAYDYIHISNPFLHKIPIAVPAFKPLPPEKGFPADADADKTESLAVQAADLLAHTLNFTCYFKILERDAFLEHPRDNGITNAEINHKNWRDIGTEFLITGGVTCQGDILSMELRLFDVFKEKLLAGRKYKGNIKKQRAMIRRFGGEVMEVFTGNRGIFESRIAFVSTGSGNKEIYVCDFDGHAPRRITHNNVLDLSPSWSSDGRWLAFTSYRNNRPDLYLHNLDESRNTVISAREGANISPAWRPGQFSLAACLSFTGDQELYLLSGTGKIMKRLTHSWGIDVSPTFSPTGKKIAFVSKRSGTPQLFIKDLESGDIQRLTFEGEYNTNPSWSPAGDKIAYCGLENGHFNIYVIDRRKGETFCLTHNQGDNESPAWSPDGSLIAFSSTREGSPAIYVMTSAGTDQRRLLTLAGEQTCPRWSLNINTKNRIKP